MQQNQPTSHIKRCLLLKTLRPSLPRYCFSPVSISFHASAQRSQQSILESKRCIKAFQNWKSLSPRGKPSTHAAKNVSVRFKNALKRGWHWDQQKISVMGRLHVLRRACQCLREGFGRTGLSARADQQDNEADKIQTVRSSLHGMSCLLVHLQCAHGAFSGYACPSLPRICASISSCRKKGCFCPPAFFCSRKPSAQPGLPVARATR